jgi:predicted SAM-dependent methyltransferase
LNPSYVGFEPEPYTLNIGCGGREGDKFIWYGHVRLDIEWFPNVTHVGDAHDLPFEDKTFDLIVCYVTLEHLYNPFKAVSEMIRVLKDNGMIKIVIPNVHHWRRIYKNYQCRIDLINKSDLNKLPDHKQAWDLVEIRNLVRHLGLVLISVKYLNWIDEFVPNKSFKHKIINYILPNLFTHTEVEYVLCKEMKRN